ncbi:hypothetical protein TDB9533_03464 [Thalassocella blandensis]|nr:hypothetical protein TDB9533_03464 [Thalassocella blandensis]
MTSPTSNEKLMFPLGVMIFLVITLACFNMHLFARGGLMVDTPDFVERLTYMQQHLVAWRLLWLNWMFAALGLLMFACMLAQFISQGYLRTFGLLVMALGIAPDISGECIYAFILPLAQADSVSQLAMLQTLEVIAMNLTGTVGNGFYNVGGLILNLLLFQNLKIPRWIIMLGIPAWPLGLALSVSTALGMYHAAEWFTALAMVWSTLWILLLSVTLFKNSQEFTPV